MKKGSVPGEASRRKPRCHIFNMTEWKRLNKRDGSVDDSLDQLFGKSSRRCYDYPGLFKRDET